MNIKKLIFLYPLIVFHFFVHCQPSLEKMHFELIESKIALKNSNVIYMLGENNNVKGDKQIGFEIFKYLYDNNVRVWVLDESVAYEYYLNKYLKTGNKKHKNKAVKLKYIQQRKNETKFIDSLYKFKQQKGNTFKVITITQIDNSNKYANLEALNIILQESGVPPKKIQNDIYKLKKNVNNKVIIPTDENIFSAIDALKKGLSLYPEEYDLFFGEDVYFVKKMIISFEMINDNPIGYNSILWLEKRSNISIELLINVLNTNKNNGFFIQTRPYMAAGNKGDFNCKIINFEPISLKLKDSLTINREFVFMNIFYPKNNDSCNSVGLNKEEVVNIRELNRISRICIIPCNNNFGVIIQNDFFDYLIINNF